MPYELTNERKAALDTIAWAEGSPRYDQLFNYVQFPNWPAPHPNLEITAGGFTSTAAGRYQFLYSSWINTIQDAGLADFMDEYNQDQAALTTIDLKRNALGYIDNRDILSALDSLSYEWASLPPYRYAGQGTKTTDEVINYFNERLEYYDNDGLGIFYNDTFTPVNEVNGLTISVILFVIALIIYFVANKNTNK
jgi:muramidase (phage lysozyme)